MRYYRDPATGDRVPESETLNDTDLARRLGIPLADLDRWLAEHPDFPKPVEPEQ